MSRSVGIMVHRSRTEALAFADKVADWLETQGVSAWFDPSAAQRLGRPEKAFVESELADLEFFITLGGDGTILTTARLAAPLGIPILGVHMGRFGFIAETHPDDLFPRLKAILHGQMEVEERLMIHGEVRRNGERVHQGIGLNEAVVKSGMSHLLRLQTSLGGLPFATYPADGLIIAVPTGSTAYSLSAGGPLVSPTVQALLITPICPHTLSARPLVVPSDEIVEIEIEADGGEIIFSVDGVEPFALHSGDHVLVHRADYKTRLIVLDPTSFYRKVRDRYLYGERLNG